MNKANQFVAISVNYRKPQDTVTFFQKNYEYDMNTVNKSELDKQAKKIEEEFAEMKIKGDISEYFVYKYY